MDIAEIDIFLEDKKHLLGPAPEWQQSSRIRDMEASWQVEDSVGIVRAHVRFRFLKTDREHPSLSLIFQNAPIWRVDLRPPESWKTNPPAARAMGLPAIVKGSHSHGWQDHRAYCMTQRAIQLPFRRPLPAKIRKLPQALIWLAEQVNLTIGPDQRDFDVPPKSDLFE
jgi:hypothetical protein